MVLPLRFAKRRAQSLTAWFQMLANILVHVQTGSKNNIPFERGGSFLHLLLQLRTANDPRTAFHIAYRLIQLLDAPHDYPLLDVRQFHYFRKGLPEYFKIANTLQRKTTNLKIPTLVELWLK